MIEKRLNTAFAVIFSCMVPAELSSAEKPQKGDVEAGKARSVLCAGCHGPNGEGKNMPDGQASFPRLAGQVPGYFIKAIYDYKMDRRNDAMMSAIAKGLSDIDIANLTAYYASLK